MGDVFLLKPSFESVGRTSRMADHAVAWNLLDVLMITHPKTRIAALLAALMALGACSDRSGDDAGLDMRSRGTGERDERLGNDPKEQNTGEGSTPERDVGDPPANPPN